MASFTAQSRDALYSCSLSVVAKEEVVRRRQCLLAWISCPPMPSAGLEPRAACQTLSPSVCILCHRGNKPSCQAVCAHRTVQVQPSRTHGQDTAMRGLNPVSSMLRLSARPRRQMSYLSKAEYAPNGQVRCQQH